MGKQQTRERALTALIEGGTLTEAAEKAGISRRTLYSYLHDDIEFARAYKQTVDQQALLRLETLENERRRASAVLLEIMEDKGQPGANRIKAAQLALDQAKAQAELAAAISTRNIDRNKGLFDQTIE